MGEGVLYNLVFTEWRHCVSQNIALRRFLHIVNHGNIATEGSPRSALYSTLIEWLKEFLIVLIFLIHDVILKMYNFSCYYQTRFKLCLCWPPHVHTMPILCPYHTYTMPIPCPCDAHIMHAQIMPRPCTDHVQHICRQCISLGDDISWSWWAVFKLLLVIAIISPH